jgi:hypothetical protein
MAAAVSAACSTTVAACATGITACAAGIAATAAGIAATAACITATSITAMAVAAVTPTAVTPAPASVAIPAAVPAPAPPWTYADKQSVVEPSGPVKAVGSAGVGIVRVIAPIANRRSVNHGSGNKRRADSYILVNIFILGYCRYRERQNQEHC